MSTINKYIEILEIVKEIYEISSYGEQASIKIIYDLAYDALDIAGVLPDEDENE
jgi:hypothetical protein